jgi:transposase
MAHQGRRRTDHQLLMALACGATVEAAARQTGLSESTVYRRLQSPEFKRELNQLRSEMVQRAAAMLTAASMESVKTLLELQKSPNPGATRLGAARSILEIGIKLRSMAELEVRVGELELLVTGKDPDD